MANLLSQWKESLSRTSKAAFGQLATILGASEITEETWDDLEALLLQADMGIETTASILDSLKRVTRDSGLIYARDLTSALRSELLARLTPPPTLRFDSKPTIILVVGVNGSGKTTTIAKLSARFNTEGKKILLGAADTFRAAATDQLQVWGERLNIEVITGASESDPGRGRFQFSSGRRSARRRYYPHRYCRALTHALQSDGGIKKSEPCGGQSAYGSATRGLACAGCHNRAKRFTTGAFLQRSCARYRRDIIKT